LQQFFERTAEAKAANHCWKSSAIKAD